MHVNVLYTVASKPKMQCASFVNLHVHANRLRD